MRAEIAKLRHLPTPRWTAAAVAAVLVLFSGAMVIVAPDDPTKHISVPGTAVGLPASVAAMVFGVWMATLEFSAARCSAR